MGTNSSSSKIPIGEVAKRAGIKASAIRYYESEGLLPKAARRGGRRAYEEAILDQLTFIDLSKRSGSSVAEIRKLVSGFAGTAPPGVRWRAPAEKKGLAFRRWRRWQNGQSTRAQIIRAES